MKVTDEMITSAQEATRSLHREQLRIALESVHRASIIKSSPPIKLSKVFSEALSHMAASTVFVAAASWIYRIAVETEKDALALKVGAAVLLIVGFLGMFLALDNLIASIRAARHPQEPPSSKWTREIPSIIGAALLLTAMTFLFSVSFVQGLNLPTSHS